MGNKRDVYVIMGAPGSGKTSQGILLSNNLNINHISWGKLSRDQEFKSRNKDLFSQLEKTKQDISRSRLIASAIQIKLDQLIENDPDFCLVMDGFPRRLEEAEKLVEILKKHNLRIKGLILLNASFNSIVNRVTNRVVCNLCGRKFDPSNHHAQHKICPYDNTPLHKENFKLKDLRNDYQQYLSEALPAFNYLKQFSESHFTVTGDDDDIVVASNIILKLHDGHKIDSVIYKRQSETFLPTKYGQFQIVAYQSVIDYSFHLALIKGDVTNKSKVLVRVHSSCITGDIFGSLKCDCGPQLHSALRRIEKEECGIVLYLFQEGRGINIINKIMAYQLQYNGLDTVEANEKLGLPAELRQYDVVKNILDDLNVKSIRLLSNNPDKLHKLTDIGVQVEGLVNLETCPVDQNKRYLETKKYKMGHELNRV